MKKTVFQLLIIVLLLPACSGFNKVLKSTDNEYKYKKAIEYYNDEDYVRAMTLFEGLIPIFKGTVKSEEVLYYYAYCHYATNDYILGGYYFRNFTKTYPNSKHNEECQFMGAYCYYKDSPKVSLDQSNTGLAINELQLFISMYPTSSRLAECNELIDDMRHKLEEKSFISAKLYYNLEDYKAARVALKNSLRDFPGSKFSEDLLFLIAKSNYLYALNSIESKQKERYEQTLKEYYTLMQTFPDGKYKKDAKSIFEHTTKELKKLGILSTTN